MFARLLQPFRRAPAPVARVATLEPAPPVALPSQAGRTDAAAGSPDSQLVEPPPLFRWLLGTPATDAGPGADAAAPAILAALDPRMNAPALPPDLLPRAANVMPQLLALMRRPATTRGAVAEQVMKDPQLTAEVLRLARSPAYGAAAVDTLEAALDRIGTSGLQLATARLLLRPVFASSGDGPMAHACGRIAALSEYKSMLCARMVQQAGGEGLDGLLAGLLHDTGTLGLLRLAERSGLMAALVAGVSAPGAEGLEKALLLRRDRLFGRLAAGWDLTPSLTALAGQLGAPLPDADSPLAQALLMADRCARADLGMSDEGATQAR